MGRISALWRFPFKSMRGEQVDEACVGNDGLPGDRLLALEDLKTGRIVSAKEIRRFPGLFGFRARCVPAAATDDPAASVMIEMPGGKTFRCDDEDADETLSDHFGREVRVVHGGSTRGDADPDLTAFHDAAPVSLITNSTLESMNALEPGSIFDARRFRMNLILDCEETGFPENDWVGRTLRVGPDLELVVTRPDARCVMTTLAQDELPEDRGILTGLARHNRLPVDGQGRYPCAGVYASVNAAGTVKVGDEVVLVEPP